MIPKNKRLEQMVWRHYNTDSDLCAFLASINGTSATNATGHLPAKSEVENTATSQKVFSTDEFTLYNYQYNTLLSKRRRNYDKIILQQTRREK